MGLVNKMSLLMAKIGCAGLRNTSENNKNNLEYVKAVVKNQGPRSFQFASDYIRSDATSILKMVDVNSAILNYTKDVILDRYVDANNEVKENEVDMLLFAVKCLEVDVNSLVYFNEDLQEKVIEVLKSDNFVKGKFAGVPCVINIETLKKNEELTELIEFVSIAKIGNV